MRENSLNLFTSENPEILAIVMELVAERTGSEKSSLKESVGNDSVGKWNEKQERRLSCIL